MINTDGEIIDRKKVECEEVLDKLSKSFKIEKVNKQEKNKKARAPFTTSTLQQAASNKLGFPGKKTMSLAQKLYEGIDLGIETTGLITYMRTDSIRLSDEFVAKTYKFIADNYSKDYIGYVKHSKKTENIQDAHEAIRPTDINKTPDKMKEFLTNDEYKLYKMIYYRALASLMKDAKTLQTTIILDNNNYQFKATGSILVFDGYLKVYKDYEDQNDKILPDLESYKTNVVLANKIEDEQHFTKPKPRFTEASLIKQLEELGIGRPSTYVKIIDTLKERNYVILEEKRFKPTEIGELTTHKLQEGFSNLINVEYTAAMEDNLDKIAEGNLVWNEMLDKFYKEFEPTVKTAFDSMEKVAPEETGELCPECEHPLVIRKGKYGPFTACSNFPKCKYIKPTERKLVEVMPCPKCDGKILEKKTKKGKVFYGCSNYPKCDFASWDKPINEKCPECGDVLVEHSKGIKCHSCNYEK